MHPELLRIGSFVLPTYGLLLAIGFVAALVLLRRRAAAFGLAPDAVSDLGIWILLAGLLGSKLTLIIVEWPHYVRSWSAFGEILRSAGVFYGGLLGAILVTLVLLRKYRLDFFTLADAAAPCVALGQAIGRLGCFAAGCCWGAEAHVPWAVRFTDPAAERNVGVPLGIPLHPTQLYESIGTLVLCILLVKLERRRFTGETFARYLVLYGAFRFTIELFRGDPRGTVFGVLSTSQLFSIVGVAAGIAVYAWQRRHAPAAAAA